MTQTFYQWENAPILVISRINNFFVKSQIINIFHFVGHKVSLTTIQCLTPLL